VCKLAHNTNMRTKAEAVVVVQACQLLLLTTLCRGAELELVASFSQRGVKGDVRFLQLETGKVGVKVDLEVAEESGGDYSWGIYEFPIDYTEEDYCHSRYLGNRPRINLEDLLGKISLPTQKPLIRSVENVTLFGADSIWSTSLVLITPGRERLCAAILPLVDDSQVQLYEARFNTPVAGSVFFHTLTFNGSTETKILTNLYNVGEPTANNSPTSHSWQIFITDIIGANRRRKSCDFLQILYNPADKDGVGCQQDSADRCRDGDLTGKFGRVTVGQQESMFTKMYLTDRSLVFPAATADSKSSRSLYLALFQADHEFRYYACAQIHRLPSRVAVAKFQHDGITGHVKFIQSSKFHPVVSHLELTGLSGAAGSYHIHEFPVPPRLKVEDTPCSATGPHYNPHGVDKSASPAPGVGTSDRYEVGDLSGKYGDLQNRTRIAGTFVDPSVSLFGANSVIGRSIVIHHSPVPLRWVCANIETEGAEMITGIAQFVYPIAGQVVFRQDVSHPLADTQVFVAGFVYSDGNKKQTDGHRWHVHEDVPGKDFFNWTGRCLSAGHHFNPYQLNVDERVYRYCESTGAASRCEVGDMVHKHATLAVAGRSRDIAETRRFFTDSNLPLTGEASILGHSLLLHDDEAPEHRGTRMACTAIRRQYRHKAVAREWFGNGIAPPVEGRMEFIQDTAITTTHLLVEVEGLDKLADTYHIHAIPVQPQLEFACSPDAVGDHFNPWNVDKTTSPPASLGTPDQYEIGDLSGKFGKLTDRQAIKDIYNDTNLPMFGSQSIVGRSVVIHKAYKGERWACSTLGWGWDPDEARQVTAIASFHHPLGYAWGYIRFSQVIYHDGSTTDTVIEVRLKYPGKTNREQSHGHAWSIYVNPVGHDASVKFERARCSAAGYRWNPTFIQLADPNDHGFYREECSERVPLRCQVGDLSGRHGPISIGSRAYVFNDANLPLSGDWYNNAVGKSIVIHGPNGASDVSMACANIEPDKDIIKYAVIRTVGGFNLAKFMEDVQGVMGVPEWYLFTDSRNTKLLHEGRCLQILLHFRGPHANQLEQDFSKLLSTGKQEKPSLAIPGYFPPTRRKTKLGYRECASRGINKKSKYDFGGSANSIKPSIWLGLVILFVCRSMLSVESV